MHRFSKASMLAKKHQQKTNDDNTDSEGMLYPNRKGLVQRQIHTVTAHFKLNASLLFFPSKYISKTLKLKVHFYNISITQFEIYIYCSWSPIFSNLRKVIISWSFFLQGCLRLFDVLTIDLLTTQRSHGNDDTVDNFDYWQLQEESPALALDVILKPTL